MRARLAATGMLAIVLLSGCSDSTSEGTERLRVLVTNDDGVQAQGIAALVDEIAKNPQVEVHIFAPAGNRSGAGDRFTTDRPLSVQEATTISGVAATAVDGQPADAALFGMLKGLPSLPDLVLSGINNGQNLGEIVFGPGLVNSGTVGAALWAARLGVPAIAVSQGSTPTDYTEAAVYTADLVERFRSDPAFQTRMRGNQSGRAVVLNVNFPTCTVGATRGIRVVPLGRSVRPVGYESVPGSTNKYTAVVEATSLFVSDCASTLAEPATDVEAMSAGFASVTPLGTDLTLTGIEAFRSLQR